MCCNGIDEMYDALTRAVHNYKVRHEVFNDCPRPDYEYIWAENKFYEIEDILNEEGISSNEIDKYRSKYIQELIDVYEKVQLDPCFNLEAFETSIESKLRRDILEDRDTDDIIKSIYQGYIDGGKIEKSITGDEQ